MPIPFIIGGAAALAAGYGIKKGLDAKEDMDTANEYNEMAVELVEKAEKSTNAAREKTSKSVTKLGHTKIAILSGAIKKFVKNFSAIKNVDFRDSVGLDELKDFGSTDREWFDNLEQASFHAAELAKGGMGGIAAGTLLAAGSYGAVASGLGGLAVASTGTAIAGLSGAAATNATLAWLGGGSLAAGGFGMAGGMVVLGGLVAGPALAIGGAFMASKASEAKYNAFETFDKAMAYDEQCKNIRSQLNATRKRAEQIDDILKKLESYMELGNDALVDVILDYGENFQSYPINCKKTVGACVQLAKTIKIILDTSLLGEDGNLTKESEKVVEVEKTFIESGNCKYLGIEK